jgi:hypothetical protein
MDDQPPNNDMQVTRQTVVHLHTLAIEQSKRTTELFRQVRDIKYAVVFVLVIVLLMALF